MTRRFYTVGHSDGSMEHLVGLLKKHEVQTAVDIRTRPGSSRAPQFHRETLESLLPSKGIAYRYRGKTLGGHPEDPALYMPDGRVDFDALEVLPEFQRAFDALLEEELKVPALLCTEANPFKCPRFFLLGRLMTARGIEVLHIDYETGRAEPHDEAEQRMLEYVGRGTEVMSLFGSAQEDLQAGYKRLKWEYEHRAPWRRKGR